MNIGGGEAADQLVRMLLSGGEVAVRLGGSAAKNLLAMSLALAKNHKKISGKVRMGKMLQQTRDLRVFPMTQEEYRVPPKGAAGSGAAAGDGTRNAKKRFPVGTRLTRYRHQLSYARRERGEDDE